MLLKLETLRLRFNLIFSVKSPQHLHNFETFWTTDFRGFPFGTLLLEDVDGGDKPLVGVGEQVYP